MVEAKIYKSGELQNSIEGSLLLAITKANGDEFESDGQMAVVGEGSKADLLDMLQLGVQYVADHMGIEYGNVLLMLMLAGGDEYDMEPINGQA